MRKDILQKVPFLDRYYDRTIPPEDNVSIPKLFLNLFFFVLYLCALGIWLPECVPLLVYALSWALGSPGKRTLIN